MSAPSYLSAGFAVCSNGAILIDAATSQIVEQIVFDLRDPISGVARAAAWFCLYGREPRRWGEVHRSGR